MENTDLNSLKEIVINDIIDSKDKLTDDEKEKLRLCFLDISNIHRSLLENIQDLMNYCPYVILLQNKG